MNDKQINTNTVVAWIGLLMAGLALFVGVMAFNRSGTDIGTMIRQQTDRAIENSQEAVDNTVPDEVNVTVKENQ